jgi:cytochrome c553
VADEQTGVVRRMNHFRHCATEKGYPVGSSCDDASPSLNGNCVRIPTRLAAATLAALGWVISGAAVAQAPATASYPSSGSFPAWAYPWAPDFKAPPDDGVPRHVPDSAAAFTVTQERDLFFAPDWHPDDHPAMPEIVAHGRTPDVRACGSCHRAEGTGGPENASLAGLPVSYIVQQMADYKSGARKFSGPQRSAVLLMTAIAKAATDADVQAAAVYFSSLKPKPTIKVVETDTVPVTQIARLFYTVLKNGGTEPIGERIIEVPVDVEQFEHRDSRAQFVAYVPNGSIAKGETLARTGGSGTTTPCGTCHGPDLRGVDAVPGIAGRSPSYLVRQLYEFQQHSRAGSAAALMAPAVEKLSHDDMISLAAYVSSLKP